MLKHKNLVTVQEKNESDLRTISTISLKLILISLKKILLNNFTFLRNFSIAK